MKVSDLAEELGVPASAVLEQCQRFNIEAGWAGAELRGADVVILRSELAAAEAPLDLTPADPPEPDVQPAVPSVPAAADAATPAAEASTPDPDPDPEPAPKPAALPPGVVGSMPELIDEVTPEIEPENEPAVLAAAGFRLAGAEGVAADSGERRVPPRAKPDRKRFQASARNSIIWLLLALVAFVASNFVDNPWMVAGFWLVGIVGICVTFYDGWRGYRSVTVHPDHFWGKWVAVATMTLSIGAAVAVIFGISVVTTETAAADAPLSAGDLSSVQSLRWGYQRLTRVADAGWHPPAKDAGTCWVDIAKARTGDAVRKPDDRVEIGNTKRRCAASHTVEVMKVFSVNHDADAPYPGKEAFNALATTRCKAAAAAIKPGKDGSTPTFILAAEYPTADGWDRGDHDVACVLITPPRRGALLG